MLLKSVLKHVGNQFPVKIARALCTQNSAQLTKSYHYDIDEIKHHESVGDWWDPNGRMKPLHAMNDIRIPLIRNSLVNARQIKPEDACRNPAYLSGINILDVGCGAGILSEAIARVGGHVTGLDVSNNLITQAREHAKLSFTGPYPSYTVSTVEDHADQNQNFYDAVVASEVVEHVSNKETFVKSCISALKPGGSLIMTTPNRTWPMWLGGIVLAEYILNAIPRGTHHYDKFITPTELCNMIEKHRLKVYTVNGVIYDILRNKWCWTETTAFVYTVHAVKLKSSA